MFGENISVPQELNIIILIQLQLEFSTLNPLEIKVVWNKWTKASEGLWYNKYLQINSKEVISSQLASDWIFWCSLSWGKSIDLGLYGVPGFIHNGVVCD